MKKYKVTVNGTPYEIEIEEVNGGAPAVASTPAAATAAPAPTPAAGGENVTAPMPGNILDVKVAVGDTVKQGDVLLILEAMKMENEIMAGKDGKVTAVNVKKGDTVETGTALVTIG